MLVWLSMRLAHFAIVVQNLELDTLPGTLSTYLSLLFRPRYRSPLPDRLLRST